MTFVAVAVGGAALVNGIMSSKAASDAADTQADAARAGQRLTMDQFNQTRQDQAPYRQTGYNALAQLQYLLGMGPNGVQSPVGIQDAYVNANAKDDRPLQPKRWVPRPAGRDSSNAKDEQTGPVVSSVPFSPIGAYGSLSKTFDMGSFHQDPGYQFRIDEANKALQRSAAARGGLLSGGTMRGLADLNQNLASQEYNNAYSRFNNDQTTRFNRLASLAGIGQTATNFTGQLGANAANNAAEYGTQAANASAAGALGQAQAWNQGINTGINALNNYNNWNQLSNMASMNQGFSNTNPWGGQLYGSANGGTQYID